MDAHRDRERLWKAQRGGGTASRSSAAPSPLRPFEPLPVFAPLVAPARYKGAWGGRGSGKSHFFAELMVEQHLRQPGLLSVCIREVQKSLKDSVKRLIEAKMRRRGVGREHGFRVYREVIQTPGDGIILFQGMQDHTAESIKSLEGFGRAWVEEAQMLSRRSMALLRPTIRAAGSELWFSWNPRFRSDPVDRLLRGPQVPTGAVVVRANWSDNDLLPDELAQERLDCLRIHPDQYDHIWEGGYVTVSEGAYYARELAAAKVEGRIGPVAFDPLMTVRLFCDIGGTGARADAFAMWPTQFVGREIRVRDYYEAVGQPLAAHLDWLRGKGYGPDRAQFWLPHDGATHGSPTKARSETPATGSRSFPTRARAPPARGSRRRGGCFPRSGSTRRRRKPGATRSAGITSGATRTATSASGRSMTGPRTAPTRSG